MSFPRPEGELTSHSHTHTHISQTRHHRCQRSSVVLTADMIVAARFGPPSTSTNAMRTLVSTPSTVHCFSVKRTAPDEIEGGASAGPPPPFEALRNNDSNRPTRASPSTPLGKLITTNVVVSLDIAAPSTAPLGPPPLKFSRDIREERKKNEKIEFLIDATIEFKKGSKRTLSSPFCCVRGVPLDELVRLLNVVAFVSLRTYRPASAVFFHRSFIDNLFLSSPYAGLQTIDWTTIAFEHTHTHQTPLHNPSICVHAPL